MSGRDLPNELQSPLYHRRIRLRMPPPAALQGNRIMIKNQRWTGLLSPIRKRAGFKPAPTGTLCFRAGQGRNAIALGCAGLRCPKLERAHRPMLYSGEIRSGSLNRCSTTIFGSTV